MRPSLWTRFTAFAVEIAVEFVHLFYQRQRCRPALSKMIHLLKVAVYFTFPLFVFALSVAFFIYFPYHGFLFQSGWGGVATAVFVAVVICRVIYHFTDRPYYYFIHKCGESEYRAEGSCVEVIRCKLCPHVETLREQHTLGDLEYVAEGSCQQRRKCTRCGHVGFRTVRHQFGEWEYTSADNCDQTRVCARDGYRETWHEAHQYSDWKYIADSKCYQEMVCSRCGRKKNRVEHVIDYAECRFITSTTLAQCKRCGDEIEVEEPYDPAAMTPEEEREYSDAFN